ncbi:nicotinamide-nucleotide amidohydrolase family protein [Planctomycetota bacterium]|nr:nicotinamide-nucleotide amidohydrolase family protein [Planctomycetota bacterium]
MQAVIITVGSEILQGRIVDTNSAWLSAELEGMGFRVVGHQSLSDDTPTIVRAVQDNLAVSRLVILTGGIGPTEDDLTREAVAKALDQPLGLDDSDLDRLRAWYQKRQLPFPAGSERQCMRPRGAELIRNNYGTASCFLARKSGGAVAVLPGIPAELTGIWEDALAPALQELAGERREVRELKLIGAVEPEINNRVAHLLNTPVVQGAILVSNLELTLRWSCPAGRAELLPPIIEEAKSLLGDYVFSDGPNLAQAVVAEFAADGQTIATAESCTGGLIADMLTDVSGSSDVLKAGFVTYSRESKVALGVPQPVIAEEGVVSEAVALEMAEHAAQSSGASYAVSTTGVAGPGPDNKGNPAGMVWVGIKGAGVHLAVRLQIPGTRRVVKMRAAKSALYYLHHLRKHRKLPRGFFLEYRPNRG